jgi:hypothetical protein
MNFKILAKLGIIKIPPSLWELIHPHEPKVSQVFIEYMAAGLVRDVARQVSNKSISKDLMAISHDMAKTSTSSMVAGWDDGDICPPWWWHGPWPRPNWGDLINPPIDLGSPDPYPLLFRVKGIEQLVLADVLVSLSEVTTNIEHSKALINSAMGIAKTFGSLTDDIANAGANARKLG